CFTPETRSERVSQLSRCALIEFSILSFQTEVIQIDARASDACQRSDAINAPKLFVRFRTIVENPRLGLDGFHCEGIDSSLPHFENRLHTVKALANVWP